MINKILALIAIAGLTIACQTTPTIPENGSSITARLEQPFSLPIEQVAEIPSEDLRVRFIAVEEDSRCPEDVQCVWEGEVKIRVNLAQNNRDLGNFSAILSSRNKDRAIVSVEGYSLELLEVNPYPKNPGKLDVEDYVATLQVSRK